MQRCVQKEVLELPVRHWKSLNQNRLYLSKTEAVQESAALFNLNWNKKKKTDHTSPLCGLISAQSFLRCSSTAVKRRADFISASLYVCLFICPQINAQRGWKVHWVTHLITGLCCSSCLPSDNSDHREVAAWLCWCAFLWLGGADEWESVAAFCSVYPTDKQKWHSCTRLSMQILWALFVHLIVVQFSALGFRGI